MGAGAEKHPCQADSSFAKIVGKGGSKGSDFSFVQISVQWKMFYFARISKFSFVLLTALCAAALTGAAG